MKNVKTQKVSKPVLLIETGKENILFENVNRLWLYLIERGFKASKKSIRHKIENGTAIQFTEEVRTMWGVKEIPHEYFFDELYEG